jgi:hypothetical protein
MRHETSDDALVLHVVAECQSPNGRNDAHHGREPGHHHNRDGAHGERWAKQGRERGAARNNRNARGTHQGLRANASFGEAGAVPPRGEFGT